MIQNLIFLSCFNANAVGNVHANAKPIYQFALKFAIVAFSFLIRMDLKNFTLFFLILHVLIFFR